MKFRDLPNEEKPRERLILYGADTLSNEELLAILIGSGTRDNSALDIARGLLDKYGNKTTFSETGKVIYISCSDIEDTGTLQCNVIQKSTKEED